MPRRRSDEIYDQTLSDLGDSTTEDESEDQKESMSDYEEEEDEVKHNNDDLTIVEDTCHSPDEIEKRSALSQSYSPLKASKILRQREAVLKSMPVPIKRLQATQKTTRYARPSSADETDEGHEALIASVLAKYGNI